MPRRPQVGVHDDPAEGFAIYGGLAVVAFAAAIFLDQGSYYGCDGGAPGAFMCSLGAFELGPVGEVGLASLAAVGAVLAVTVFRSGWDERAARVALGLAVVTGVVFGWWWFTVGGVLPIVLGLAATAMLGFAGGRGVFVGTDLGTAPSRD